MNQALTLSALQQGTLHLEGQFIYGSNYTFMVLCQHSGETLKAVYKPLRGERPLPDFPTGTLAQREVAAYTVSEALGWGLVPPTIFRVKGRPWGRALCSYSLTTTLNGTISISIRNNAYTCPG